MLTAIKGLLSSKKFYLTIIGSGVVGGLTYAGVPHSVILMVASLFGLNIAAQGVADINQ